MSNPSTLTLQLAAAVSNGIALSQTPGAAGNLTLNGSLVTSGVATMDVARRVLISTAGADAARTFTITGTDRYGNVQVEAITGIPTGTTGATQRDFKTVTKIAVDAATAGAITAGTNGVGSSDWVVDDFLCRVWALSGGIQGAAATTYTLEVTYDDPNKTGTSLVVSPQQWSMNPASHVPPLVWPYAPINNASGNNQFDFPDHPIFAHRLTINSGTGLVVMQSIQAGVGSGL